MIQQLGQGGAGAVREKYAIDNTVKRMIELFGSLSCQ